MMTTRTTTSLVCVALAACGGMRGDDEIDGNATAIRFTQAIGGAMWVNPDAYATIPVHAIVEGEPARVLISVDGVAFEAEREDSGRWTAQITVATLADGNHEMVAESHGVTTSATLGVGREGIQWTFIGTDMNAATPRLHRLDERMFLTWTDVSIGSRVAWVQEIDGIGRAVGDKLALVGGAGLEDKLYARTAFGASTVGVLYQERGGPYKNFFTVVTTEGREMVAPIALDPSDRFGSNSGDVTFTGTGYDIVWRTNSGAGSSDVRWMHVDEASGAVIGPVIVATPGNDDPHGGFDAITNVTIGHHEGASLIAFSRYLYDPQLELEILKCQLATVIDGVASTELVGIGNAWSWDNDCRILDDGTGPVAVRSAKSLTSNEDNPPDEMFAVRVPLASDRGDGRMIVSAPETRVEPTMIGTSARPILAWSDSRSYATDITTGEVELYAAVLGADLVSGDHIRFAHSHFIEGSADIRGVAAGENAIITWIDERHGGNVLDPRPEVYLETIWQ
jgi:hypothetical protein